MANLAQKSDRKRRIFRGEETYGDGTAAAQATRYRLTEMYAEVVAAATDNSADVAFPPVDLLVSLSGFSPETTLLAYELIRPARLLIISSENAQANVDVIWDKLDGRLRFSDVTTRLCEPADPLGIYDIIRREVVREGIAPRTIIDITGGKKVMSAGAALVASQLDLPMCYIDSSFDPEMRQAQPGTERLRILPNPTALFGDRDMEAAAQMFRSGVYSGAAARFSELSTTMSEPVRARVLADVAAFYQAWCDLDTVRLPELAARLRERVADQRSALRPETARRLANQADFTDRLTAGDGSAALLSFYLLGEHYLQMDRYDFAALFFYRTIEKALSERMCRGYGGFASDRPQWELLDSDVASLAARFESVATEVFGGPGTSGLPWRVSLVDAMVLLHVLGDEMLPAARVEGVRGLRHVRGLAEVRNRSVLAHGKESVAKDQCELLRVRAQLILRAFWRLHEAPEDVDERIGALRFVDEA